MEYIGVLKSALIACLFALKILLLVVLSPAMLPGSVTLLTSAFQITKLVSRLFPLSILNIRSLVPACWLCGCPLSTVVKVCFI